MPDPVLTPDKYPYLDVEGYSEESLATPMYNCIAWTVGDLRRWWWPPPHYYWPDGCVCEPTINAFSEMFESLGYEECATADVEPKFEKIALFAVGGIPKHAAKQCPDGSWKSKMGRYIDIRHTLRGLQGPFYGDVVKLFRKPINRP